MTERVIAVDGPAASGKSTVARKLASRIGFRFASSGEFYRALTWAALRENVDFQCADAIERFLEQVDIKPRIGSYAVSVLVNGVERHEELFGQNVNAAVSQVSALPPVRSRLLGMLRSLGEGIDLVMEGRDIGTVVFPETPWKIFLDAHPDVRARRRVKEGKVDSVGERDRIDSTRAAAPLARAEDALLIDTSEMSVDEVVENIVSVLREKGGL